MRLLLIAVLLAGCGASETDDANSRGSSDQQRLAQAMCADLENGLSLFQMHSQAVEHYREMGRSEDAAQLGSAELQDLATRQYCPEFRSAFEATFTYEEWIAPQD